MKNTSKKPKNLLSHKSGKARFYRKVKAKKRWNDPAVPEFEPNWLVRFSVCGQSWMEMPAAFPVAEGMDHVREWAKERIETEAHLLQTGQCDKLRAMRTPPRIVMLAEVIQVYLQHVSPTKLKSAQNNAGRLGHIGSEMTGLRADQVPMTDAVWSKENLRGWVRMRQEYFRRGWSAENPQHVPADVRAQRWQQLREALAAGALPGLDEDTEMEGNTTFARTAEAPIERSVQAELAEEVRNLRIRWQLKGLIALPEGDRAAALAA